METIHVYEGPMIWHAEVRGEEVCGFTTSQVVRLAMEKIADQVTDSEDFIISFEFHPEE